MSEIPPGLPLSVLIASHNRRQRLRRCLDSLVRQDCDPADFEVVVALDGSTDGTAAELDRLQTPFALHVLELEKGGKAAALNAAIELATGEVCVYLDDDMIAAPRLVSAYLEAHRSEPRTLGLGAIVQRPIEARDWTSRTFALAWNKMFEERESRPARWTDTYGGNFSAPRRKVIAAGGVKAIPVAEDLELGFRLHREGCVPTYLPEASAIHDDQKPGSRVLADRVRQGRAHVQLAADFPELEPALLAWGPNTVRGEQQLVRALIALRVPPRLLAALGPLVPPRFALLWLELAESAAFWGAVRASVGRERWRQLTAPAPAAKRPVDDALRDEERRGASSAGPTGSGRPELGLAPGAFAQPTPREVALRRILLRLGVAPSALTWAGAPLPAGPRQTWLGFVRRYAFWRGARAAMPAGEWKQVTGGVPVLMYHAFSGNGERGRFVIPARSFARQMRLLAALRYRVVTLEELGRALSKGEPLPRRAVAITIDDGYRDNLEIALPILRRHGFRATVFLVSERLGAENDWDRDNSPGGRPLLSAAEVAEMGAGGLRFGAHTRTHCKLTEAGDGEMREQIAGSRADLEAALGTEVSEFSYPYGLYDERAVAAVGAAGFAAACTTYGRSAQRGDDPLEIPRIEVDGRDSLLAFLRKLSPLRS